jgi:hypothetical protein
MLRNGLFLVADAAARRSGVEAVERWRSALVLGSLREDILWVAPFGLSEYPSFRHFGGLGRPGGYLPFWPGPRRTADTLYRRALAHARADRHAEAFVAVGRILHVVTDACIPSHVHRAAHGRDPFEWHVEGNIDRLAALPSPDVELADRPSTIITRLAKEAARYRPDRTNTPIGRIFRRAGLMSRVGAAEARTQAEALIPLAIGHATAVLRMFARDASERV